MYYLNYYAIPVISFIMLLVDLILLFITIKMIGFNKRFQKMMKEEFKKHESK